MHLKNNIQKKEKSWRSKTNTTITTIEGAKADLLNDCSTLTLISGDDEKNPPITKTDTQCICKLQFKDPKGKEWFITGDITIDASTKEEKLQTLIMKEKENETNQLKIEIIHYHWFWKNI